MDQTGLGWTWMDSDEPGWTRSDPGGPGRTWTDPEGPGWTRTVQESSGLVKIDPDGPGWTRTVQESSGLVKIRLLILYSESYTIIGDFCPKPFGLFLCSYT